MSSVLAVQHRPQNHDFARSQAIVDRCLGDQSVHSTTAYEPGLLSWFQGGLPTPPGTKDMTGVSLNGNSASISQHQHYGSKASYGPVLQPYRPHSRVVSDPYLSTKQNGTRATNVFDLTAVEKSKSINIASHLQIPESVNKSKGSLAEFAAEITCLFWFESAATLDYAERLPVDAPPDRGLVPDATPSIGFRKWVTTILSTTQVGKNVVLLALMFIYRLKKFNPGVSGKRGSEFRLLTIALMLGNKFLDDNTYTNKTWAEVSGISVTEIHIMEVEFLSNMKYAMYASEADWARWKALLGKFGTFYEKALNFHRPGPDDHRPPAITPTPSNFVHKLPSPPTVHLSSISKTNYNTLPNPMNTLPHLPRSPVRQYISDGAIFDRKRSIDSIEGLPPAKRVQYSSLPTNVPSPVSLPPNSISQSDFTQVAFTPFAGARIPQLPMPRLPPTSVAPGSHLAPLALPSTRPMASVYSTNSSTPTWSQPITPVNTIPPTLTNPFQNSITPINEGVRSTVGSAHTSPVNLFGQGTPTKQGLSPSYFLTNRSSPYKPVRHVSTLLIPPPPAAMQNSVRNIGYEQMHYQPIGRPSERHSGPVPFYQTDSWNNSNVLTPTTTTTLYRPF